MKTFAKLKKKKITSRNNFDGFLVKVSDFPRHQLVTNKSLIHERAEKDHYHEEKESLLSLF